jgi:TetR/AcrR family transcriptional repressor of bet genes
MPKLGMGPIRREQICRAAARVISEQGFAGTTMRMVAEEAGVSTGMLNHYFANRMEMLEETLLFVSQRQQERETAAIEGVPAGKARLRALVRSVLPTDQDSTEAWRVWIAAHGASVRLPHLRKLMGSRNDLYFEILERGLEGIVPKTQREKVPYIWQLDALMNGLITQAITSEVKISFKDIEDAVVQAALEHGSVVSNGKVPATRAGAAARR